MIPFWYILRSFVEPSEETIQVQARDLDTDMALTGYLKKQNIA